MFALTMQAGTVDERVFLAVVLLVLTFAVLGFVAVVAAGRAVWLAYRRRQGGRVWRRVACASLVAAVLSVTLHATFPINDPCYGLDWTNPFYYLYGCFMY